MSETPQITVYIPSHNYGHYLKYAIESVLRQTYKSWELLLVDDNSSDNTQEIINLYKGDPRVREFRTEGVGLIGVCNLALKESKGRYLIRLDADDVFDENILLVLSTHLEQNPEHALVFPDYYLVDEFGDIFLSERRSKLYESNHLLDMPPHGACTLVKKEVLEQVGGYNQDLGAQDGLDLWQKVASQFKAGNVNVPLFYYRRHDANLTNAPQRILEARRKIKKEAIQSMVEHHAPVIAVIPCRENYDFTENVWSLTLGGYSLLERSIKTCLSSKLINKVVVMCDNPEAKNELKNFSDERLFFELRTPEETIRSESIVPSLEKVVRNFDPHFKGLTLLCYPQAPFVSTDSLEEALATLIINDADASFGVEVIEQNLFKRSPFGLEAINKPKKIVSDFDTIYAEARLFQVTKSANLQTGSLTGPRIANFLVDKNEIFFIDTQKKLQIASILEVSNSVHLSAYNVLAAECAE